MSDPTSTDPTSAPPTLGAPSPGTDARRAFLCKALGAGAAVLGAAALAPPLVVLVSPAFEGSEGSDGPAWVDLGPASMFEVGAPPRRVVLRADRRDAWLARRDAPLGTVYVQRTAEATFLVHSSICTHLGCAVALSADGFRCPCHGATFARDGALTTEEGRRNPAPRPLDTLDSRIDAASGHLEVQWMRFELNVPEKRPLDKAVG